VSRRAGGGAGLRFYKLSGSGNDFVFFDARQGVAPFADEPSAVAALCARGTGVGADGVVFLDAPEAGVVRIVYLNSDGSRAALCGNATLCTARLSAHLGLVRADEPFVIRTDAGDHPATVDADGRPAFELAPLKASRSTPPTCRSPACRERPAPGTSSRGCRMW
jgi:diaminopimelate epimerase